MAKDLDPRNKTNSLQRVHTGSMAVKAFRSASSGFSLTPESRPSAAAVEAEKRNPKVAVKEKECGDQGQGDGKEGYDSSKQLPDAHCAPQRWRLCPKISQLQTPIQPILIFFEISMTVMNLQRMW
jgi:hypothetical protein